MSVTHHTKKRTGILISGRGTNMKALIEAAEARDYPAEIVVVVSNRADAGGLDIARGKGVATEVVPSKAFADRLEFERALADTLRPHALDLLCLAGFMRVLTPWFVEQWQGRMLNIHPSLLPLFPGTHTHERVLEAGLKTHGCTVHFVTPQLDAGPVIAQASIAVEPGDTPETLAARLLTFENRLYPEALAKVASGAVQYPGRADSS
ncbi:MAG: phosphoribosylglycinamide formyltransferase [Methylobacteriaceae bacterium]|jgi:phosphoribosylglycinamide formyltransferase-1|nr:phosphoribosylglycinamide formyltransferase [Methylobacteriaceae bacterium]